MSILWVALPWALFFHASHVLCADRLRRLNLLPSLHNLFGYPLRFYKSLSDSTKALPVIGPPSWMIFTVHNTCQGSKHNVGFVARCRSMQARCLQKFSVLRSVQYVTSIIILSDNTYRCLQEKSLSSRKGCIG